MIEPGAIITVIAGTNGAGKSSLIGQAIRKQGADYFNPDQWARRFKADNPALTDTEANGKAWQAGYDLLVASIDANHDYAFETTLGGRSMTAQLVRAAENGRRVRVRYIALDSPQKHIERVRARVAKGGHAIPEPTIRQRYISSLENLLYLMPFLDSLELYDNSVTAAVGKPAAPVKLLNATNGSGQLLVHLPNTPEWAKPIVAMACKIWDMRLG